MPALLQHRLKSQQVGSLSLDDVLSRTRKGSLMVCLTQVWPSNLGRRELFWKRWSHNPWFQRGTLPAALRRAGSIVSSLVGSTGLTYFNLDNWPLNFFVYFQLLSVSCFPWLTATGAESSELADLDWVMKPGIPSQVKDGQSSFKQFPSHVTKCC